MKENVDSRETDGERALVVVGLNVSKMRLGPRSCDNKDKAKIT